MSLATFVLDNLLWLIIDEREALFFNDDFRLIDYVWEFIFCLIFTILSLFYSYVFFRFFFSATRPYRGMIVCVFALFLLNVLAACIFITLIDMLPGEESLSEVLQVKSVFTFGMIASFVSCIYSNTLYLESYMTERDEKQHLEVELLREKEITLKTQLNFLKLQINPHFMFNNFSILSELIEEDKTLAGDFLAHLSSVYRYIIQNTERNTVPIAEEMKFLSSYLYLIRMRYEDSVAISIAPEMNALSGSIPPASLQMLVENAIKHNQRSRQNPLQIDITCVDRHIVVRNTICPILSQINSTRIGQRNIVERYALLSDKRVEISRTDEFYTVSLPIL